MLRASRRMKSARRSNGIHPSLLDIAFCLVFEFLLLSTLATSTQNEAVERTLPPIKLAEMEQGEGSTGLTECKTVTITVAPGPVYFLDSERLSLEKLEERLAALRPPMVEIRGDTTVPYGAITTILALCKQNGITSVAITYKTGAVTGSGSTGAERSERKEEVR